jgi:hypothetical protein
MLAAGVAAAAAAAAASASAGAAAPSAGVVAGVGAGGVSTLGGGGTGLVMMGVANLSKLLRRNSKSAQVKTGSVVKGNASCQYPTFKPIQPQAQAHAQAQAHTADYQVSASHHDEVHT